MDLSVDSEYTYISLSWDDKWTWKHPDFYIFSVSSERLNGNCCTLSSPTGNVVGMALRHGEEEPRIGSAEVGAPVQPYNLLRDVIAAAANPAGWILLPVRGIAH